MNNRRAFTVLELVIVIGVILVLMSLALTVTSVVLAANDRRSVQSTFVLLDQAITSWESQAGREMTAGRRANPPGTPTVPDFTLGTNGPTAGFDVYEENFNTTYAMCVVLERLATSPDSAEIIARLPSTAIRFVPLNGTNAIEPLPTNWTQTTPQQDPNQMPPYASVREIFDPWNRRIGVIFPGRAATKAEVAAAVTAPTSQGIDVEDGSVRTMDEHFLGICRNRKMCFVSAGPDGDMGTTADNIYSYEPLPRPAQ
ncbi:MAG: type II secretion system protein [Planctomycetota bacterium]